VTERLLWLMRNAPAIDGTVAAAEREALDVHFRTTFERRRQQAERTIHQVTGLAQVLSVFTSRNRPVDRPIGPVGNPYLMSITRPGVWYIARFPNQRP